jgi:1-acyl-sn-glycerol-3-phosphate acyltransferase
VAERPDLVADDPWWRLGLGTVGVLFHSAVRLRVEGLPRIPAGGPAILAANHVSPLDPIAICLAAAKRGRTVRYLTAVEAFDIPVIGWGLKRLRQIPIRRGAGDRAALQDAAGVIAKGALAGIFPEGRQGSGRALLPARHGMARLALAARAPVVPMGVWGMQRRWSRDGILWGPPVRPVAALVVGEPLTPDGDPGNDEDVRILTERAMASIATLVEQAKLLAGDRASQSEASTRESSG